MTSMMSKTLEMKERRPSADVSTRCTKAGLADGVNQQASAKARGVGVSLSLPLSLPAFDSLNSRHN
jgi:hypothetical protein